MSPENAPSEVNVIDFHTHTILSDGELIASELVRRACNIGYRAIGLADHADGIQPGMACPQPGQGR